MTIRCLDCKKFHSTFNCKCEDCGKYHDTFECFCAICGGNHDSVDCDQVYFEPYKVNNYYDIPCETNHEFQIASLREKIAKLEASTKEFQREARAGFDETVNLKPIYEKPVVTNDSEDEADEFWEKNFQPGDTGPAPWPTQQPPGRNFFEPDLQFEPTDFVCKEDLYSKEVIFGKEGMVSRYIARIYQGVTDASLSLLSLKVHLFSETIKFTWAKLKGYSCSKRAGALHNGSSNLHYCSAYIFDKLAEEKGVLDHYYFLQPSTRKNFATLP